MNRKDTKENEINILAEEYKKNPNLFARETIVDSPEFLEKFGFFVDGKESFPQGYIKLWPQDFIVEEITKEKEIQTIEVENFLHKNKHYLEKDPAIYSTLVKCDLSTLEAVEEISLALNIPKNQIKFSGIKDKDAITSQLISLRKTNAEKIKEINSPYFFLKNSYSGKGTMEIGSLEGNEFTILIRTNKDFSENLFMKNLDNVSKKGFYNFFYLQRFGTPRLINFNWGFMILRGEYEKAVLGFLSSPGERELAYFKEIRKKIRENFGNWLKIKEIIGGFPLIFTHEIKIIEFLEKNPTDFLGALRQIPDQVQLWVFALGSLFFNKKISYLLKEKQKIPDLFPLILSDKEKDWIFYKDLLAKNGIHSIPFYSLKHFPDIQLRTREIPTKIDVKILNYKIIPEGVILDFILPKGAYATTFLAHIFNLVSGLPPENISMFSIDTKGTLGKNSLEETLNKFKDVIHPKNEDLIKNYTLENK